MTAKEAKALEAKLNSMTDEDRIELNRRAYASVASYLIANKGATKKYISTTVASEFNELSDGEKGENPVLDAERYVTAIYRVARRDFLVANEIVIAKLAEHGVR